MILGKLFLVMCMSVNTQHKNKKRMLTCIMLTSITGMYLACAKKDTTTVRMNGSYNNNGSIKRNGQFATSSSSSNGQDVNVKFNGQGNIESGIYNSIKCNGSVEIGDTKQLTKVKILDTNGSINIFNTHIDTLKSNGNTLISKCTMKNGKSSGITEIQDSNIHDITTGEIHINNSKIKQLTISVPTSSSWFSSLKNKRNITIKISNSKIDKIIYKKEDKPYINFDIDKKSSVTIDAI